MTEPLQEREDLADTLARVGPIFEVAAEIGWDRVKFARQIIRSVGPPDDGAFKTEKGLYDYVLACCKRALDFKAAHERRQGQIDAEIKAARERITSQDNLTRDNLT